jgi:hypothetical protein
MYTRMGAWKQMDMTKPMHVQVWTINGSFKSGGVEEWRHHWPTVQAMNVNIRGVLARPEQKQPRRSPALVLRMSILML